MNRRRHLSEEEEALWSGYVRSLTPLPSRKAKPRSTSEAKAEPKAAAARAANTVAHVAVRPERPPLAKSPPLAPFDRRFKQRLARGRDAIDARIDLHGMTQTQAHHALGRFLRRAQADGARIVLVVTGKGVGGDRRDGSTERGVLRRQVPLWLALPELRPLIVGFEAAHVSHGGEGAIYVRMRRPR